MRSPSLGPEREVKVVPVDLTELPGRPRAKGHGGERPCRVISVTSGKGGVGKTNVAGNLAVALSQRGLEVLVVDGDLGMGDLNLLYGLAPKHTLLDVLSGERAIDEVVAEGPAGVRLLPACAASFRLANLSAEERQNMLLALTQLSGHFDVIVIDTGAGIGATSMSFSAAADQPMLVVTPEPSSIMDAYAVAKVLSSRHGVRRLWVLPNLVQDAPEAHQVFRTLATLVGRFLDLSLLLAGHVPADASVPSAARIGRPFQLVSPGSPASLGLKGVAQRLVSDRSISPRRGAELLLRRSVDGQGG